MRSWVHLKNQLPGQRMQMVRFLSTASFPDTLPQLWAAALVGACTREEGVEQMQ